MSETGQDGTETDDMYFARWLTEQMRRRGISGGAELSRLVSEHVGREVRRGTVNLWRSQPRKSAHALETEFVHALHSILLVPVEAVVIAEARARGIRIPPRSLLASSIPAAADRLPPADAHAIIALIERLVIAHGIDQ